MLFTIFHAVSVVQVLHTILKMKQNFKHLYHIKNELNFIWIFISLKLSLQPNQTMLYTLVIPDSPHASKAFFHFIHCRLLILHLFLLTSKGIWDTMVVSLLAGEMKSLTRRLCHGPKPQLVSDMHCWTSNTQGDHLGASLTWEGLFHLSVFP